MKLTFKAFISFIVIALYSFPCFSIDQVARVKGFTGPVIKTVSNATMATFDATVSFKYHTDDYRKAGDSSFHTFIVKLEFKEGGQWVKANTGYVEITQNDYTIGIKRPVALSLADKGDYTLPISLPLAAFGIPEGLHTITPVITVYDQQTEKIALAPDTLPSFTITQLPVKKVKVWIKDIVVENTDQHGELWDYFFLRLRDSDPDLVWRLNCGGINYFHSEYLKNSLEYHDEYQQDTCVIALGRYDKLSITVMDIDELTPNDVIGTLQINPADEAYKTGDIVTKKTGRVQKIAYRVQVLP
jgi:hypothetical protein